MRGNFVTMTLIGAFAASLSAAEPAGPTCADYAAMDSDERMASMEAMHEAMGGRMGGTGGMMMAPGKMMEHAGKACEAHPDGTVGEAMGMRGPD